MVQQVALIDPLRDFPTGACAVDRMQQEWASSTRTWRPMCVMVTRHRPVPRRWNDTYGTMSATRCSARCYYVKRSLRPGRRFPRTGGDEFLVICPDTTMEAALVVPSAFAARVETASINVGDQVLRVTISVGVAVRDRTMSRSGCPDQARRRKCLCGGQRRRRNRFAALQIAMHRNRCSRVSLASVDDECDRRCCAMGPPGRRDGPGAESQVSLEHFHFEAQVSGAWCHNFPRFPKAWDHRIKDRF